MNTHLKVAIIGAGFGGIAMANELRKSGNDQFLIFEKGNDVGGVWRDNTYPGCSCDVPSHLYSFSFAPYRSETTRYPGQTEILSYLNEVVRERDLEPHLRLNSAIVEAAYQEPAGHWLLTTAQNGQVTADSIVFAVGQLHRPYIPDLPGRDSFTGTMFHTARWDHDCDLRGANVAIVGTGASAVQLLSPVSVVAKKVSVYQRTAPWIFPKPSVQFSAFAKNALRVPGGHALYRKSLELGSDIFFSPIMRRGWSARFATWMARVHLAGQVPDLELRKKLSPDYRIGSKRILFANDFYPTLQKDNVELVAEPIQNIEANSIVASDGIQREADVIVYATGFRAPEFLVPISVSGRGGAKLHDDWTAGAEAFLGLAVPKYPNMYVLAGPNSFNPAGSNPGVKEHQVRYIMQCLRWRDEIGAAAIEVSPSAMESYRCWLHRALAKTVWPTAPPSWYIDGRNGKITNPWPASLRTFERMTRHHPKNTFIALSYAS